MREKYKKKSLDFKNPVIAAQVLESPFVPHPYIGHTMPPGKDFIGESDYISIDQQLAEIKGSSKKVVLNIGDSSTSGWDSNIVTLNRKRIEQGKNLLPAFFQYKTYSDYLRRIVGDEYIVVNAGVPAHTSLQGSLRLRELLEVFKKEEISIHLVTAYYGNNDSVWDHNRQDKEWVGQGKVRAFFKKIFCFFKNRDNSVITRVSAADYEKHLSDIVRVCKDNNIDILLIKPLTPLYWKPGTRVLSEDLVRINYPGSKKIYELLDHARSLWEKALGQSTYTDLKHAALEEAREKDYIVPRIKRDHLVSFESVLRKYHVPYVDVELDRSVDDIRYFIDYCHPIGEANEAIAASISEYLSGKQNKKLLREGSEELLGFRGNGMDNKLEIPVGHYTLY